MRNPQMTSISARSVATWRLAATTFALLLCGAPVMFSQTASTSKPAAKPGNAAAPVGARAFPTPQAAANALIEAASTFDEPALAAMFGPDGKDLVSTGDPVRD